MAPSNLGKFITFEGIDGAGKSTHIGAVRDLLCQRGLSVVTTREPGGTPLGETLREILLRQKMHLETEALLMFAARREHIAQIIVPALERGDWVISDRFTDASFAYQGGGRGLERHKLEQLERWVHPDLQPDLTLLFDVPLEVAKSRLERSRTPDKFEKEDEAFFLATRAEYLRRARENPDRVCVIDSSRSVNEVARSVEEAIARL